MADRISTEARSRNMASIKAKDTGPELKVRRALHSLGYRYRLHAGQLPGRPDLVFKSRRALIFVHGCFWHRHSDPGCKIARIPKSRLDYWTPKLEATARRDEDNIRRLSELGWRALVIWECELRDFGLTIAKASSFLDNCGHDAN